MKSDEILIKTFDQVKNDNFDQVKFDQVIVCLLNQSWKLKKKNFKKEKKIKRGQGTEMHKAKSIKNWKGVGGHFIKWHFIKNSKKSLRQKLLLKLPSFYQNDS